MLGLYGTYLVGQMAGMSEALSLSATDVMFRYEEVPVRERREMWPRLSRIHQIIMEIFRKREERKRRRDPRG